LSSPTEASQECVIGTKRKPPGFRVEQASLGRAAQDFYVGFEQAVHHRGKVRLALAGDLFDELQGFFFEIDRDLQFGIAAEEFTAQALGEVDLFFMVLFGVPRPSIENPSSIASGRGFYDRPLRGREWWAWRDSNPRLPPCEEGTLTN
jgi:hypothetical protein